VESHYFVANVQRALASRGYSPGAADGRFGPRTTDALHAFQLAEGLSVSGITAETLTALSVPPIQQPWLAMAWSLLGTAETVGDDDNPEILSWANALQLHQYKHDSIPWCGLFVAHCLQSTGYAISPLPLSARSWIGYGEPCPPQPPNGYYGSIVVLSRGLNPYQGHVGFRVGGVGDLVQVLGGNQGDAVSLRSYPASRLLATRLPKIM